MAELEFNKDNLKKIRDSLKSQEKELGVFIYPILDQCKSEKEQIELCQTAKMLWLLNDEITIVRKFESPDFIINHNGTLIGLEHQTVKNLDKTKIEGSKKQLVDISLDIFNEKFTSYKHYESQYPKCPYMLVSVDFIRDFYFKQNQKKKIAEAISEYIWCQSQSIISDKPNFIDYIHISPHTKNSFYYKSDINRTKNLSFNRVIEAIEKKEKLVQKYRGNSETKIQWLLLTTGTLSADSFEIEKLFAEKFESSFDKIFLLDYFNSRLFEIK